MDCFPLSIFGRGDVCLKEQIWSLGLQPPSAFRERVDFDISRNVLRHANRSFFLLLCREINKTAVWSAEYCTPPPDVAPWKLQPPGILYCVLFARLMTVAHNACLIAYSLNRLRFVFFSDLTSFRNVEKTVSRKIILRKILGCLGKPIREMKNSSEAFLSERALRILSRSFIAKLRKASALT